jgi:predicted DNA-binding protein
MSEIISFRVSDEQYEELEELVEAEELESVGRAAKALMEESIEGYSQAMEVARLRVDLARALGLEDELIGAAGNTGAGNLPGMGEVAEMETLFSDTSVDFFEPVGPAAAISREGDDGFRGSDESGSGSNGTAPEEGAGEPGSLDDVLGGESE